MNMYRDTVNGFTYLGFAMGIGYAIWLILAVSLYAFFVR